MTTKNDIKKLNLKGLLLVHRKFTFSSYLLAQILQSFM